MDLNATLLGQMITFAIFVAFTARFVWPPIVEKMQAREKRIADGLADAEDAKRELDLAKRKALDIVRDAKNQASQILDESHKLAGKIVEDAKNDARVEGDRLVKHAKEQINQEVMQAKENLREHVAGLAVAGAERILQQKVDETAHRQILDALIEEV